MAMESAQALAAARPLLGGLRVASLCSCPALPVPGSWAGPGGTESEGAPPACAAQGNGVHFHAVRLCEPPDLT